MDSLRIQLPSIKWLTGNDVENSINPYTGSYGTDPLSGFSARSTMAFRARFVMPAKPAEGEPPPEHPEIPAGFEASYKIIYPFGHKPSESDEKKKFFEYEPTGGEPREISPKAVDEAQRWLNEELEALIKDGTIIPVEI